MPLDKKKLAVDIGKIALNTTVSASVAGAAHYGLDYDSKSKTTSMNEEFQFGLMLFGGVLLLKFFDYLYNHVLPKHFTLFQNKNKLLNTGEILGGIASAMAGSEIGKLYSKRSLSNFLEDISTLTIPISTFVAINVLLKSTLDDSISHSSKRFIAGSTASVSILLSGIFLALRNEVLAKFTERVDLSI